MSSVNMKALVVLSVVAACAHARVGHLLEKRAAGDVIGDSGAIINGQPIQFTSGPAKILLRGPSGIIWDNGQTTQLRSKRSPTFGAIVGPSGVVGADGSLHQLPSGVKVASAGPSGAVLTNGKHIQYRLKRSTPPLVGASGIILPDGTPVQLNAGEKVVVAGSSGAVLSTGRNIQFRKKRNAPGAPAFIKPNGMGVQLPSGVVVASAGPAGVVLSDGTQIQYTDADL